MSAASGPLRPAAVNGGVSAGCALPRGAAGRMGSGQRPRTPAPRARPALGEAVKITFPSLSLFWGLFLFFPVSLFFFFFLFFWSKFTGEPPRSVQRAPADRCAAGLIVHPWAAGPRTSGEGRGGGGRAGAHPGLPPLPRCATGHGGPAPAPPGPTVLG